MVAMVVVMVEGATVVVMVEEVEVGVTTTRCPTSEVVSAAWTGARRSWNILKRISISRTSVSPAVLTERSLNSGVRSK